VISRATVKKEKMGHRSERRLHIKGKVQGSPCEGGNEYCIGEREETGVAPTGKKKSKKRKKKVKTKKQAPQCYAVTQKGQPH